MAGPGLNRREFLKAAAVSAVMGLSGCAVNPVSGEKELILLSRSDEIALDERYSKYQFSADYGESQDEPLNAYLDEVGLSLARISHRPDMPYSFRAVNAEYLNAYAFPGGSIAVTRGLLLALEDESELAGLIGHEIAHVNWRHSASRMTSATITQLALAGVTGYAASRGESSGTLARALGGLAAGALLAHYSRDDEREADAQGTQYMVEAGYGSMGMAGLMEVLLEQHKNKPSALDLMFATHPMSQERYDTALAKARGEYAHALDAPVRRERYMDNTAGLRKIEQAVLEMQDGKKYLAKGKLTTADKHFRKAIEVAPEDYAAHVMMAQCQLERRNYSSALDYGLAARELYPAEPMSIMVTGLARMQRGDYGSAYEDFKSYDDHLPGNTNLIFFQGYCLEHMGEKRRAARRYLDYLRHDQSSDRARYAYERLVDWGVIEG
jgi:predicted Zn-dependent protease